MSKAVSAGLQAIGYVRVSTAEQAREGVSLDAQRARIEAHCAAQRLSLAAVHADEGISGRRAVNRPGLEAALVAVCEVRGVLVVYGLSRLARSVRDAITIAERIQRAGAQLVMLSEQVDTSTAAGRMFYSVLAALAQFESELIGERTRLGVRYKKERGERYCREAPFGFAFVEGMILASESEQAVLRRMRALRRQGLTCRAIAERLMEEGIRNRVGSPFPHQHVFRLLKR